MAATSILVVALILAAGVQPGDSRKLAFNTCMKQWPQVGGDRPVKAGGRMAPKKRLHIAPTYPTLPNGTSVGLEPWVGEVLIDGTGRVAHVWQLRGFRLAPDFPAFNQAVVDAIQQWRFEPFVTSGRATPVCMSVTTSINVQ